MKLNTFLLFVGLGVGAAAGGVGAWWIMQPEPAVVTLPAPPRPDPVTRPSVITPPPAPAPVQPAPASEVPATPSPVGVAPTPPPAPTAPSPDVPSQRAASAAASRPVDAAVMSYQGKNIGKDKLKDVTSGKDYKVNVYQDAGKPTVNRAKIDLDRDEKWDEKITFEEGKITRQVAPADDEAYTQTFHWSGSGWVPEGG
jgi:hypothetical protein